jgi:ABC-type transporter Mla subunit MlaD
MKQNNIELSVGAFVLLGIVAIVWFAAETAAGVYVCGSTY